MGQNLQERSLEIKMAIENELRILYKPCTVRDLVIRVKASRYPVQNHLKELMSSGKFPEIGIVHIGGYDILYRIVKETAIEMPSP